MAGARGAPRPRQRTPHLSICLHHPPPESQLAVGLGQAPAHGAPTGLPTPGLPPRQAPPGARVPTACHILQANPVTSPGTHVTLQPSTNICPIWGSRIQGKAPEVALQTGGARGSHIHGGKRHVTSCTFIRFAFGLRRTCCFHDSDTSHLCSSLTSARLWPHTRPRLLLSVLQVGRDPSFTPGHTSQRLSAWFRARDHTCIRSPDGQVRRGPAWNQHHKPSPGEATWQPSCGRWSTASPRSSSAACGLTSGPTLPGQGSPCETSALVTSPHRGPPVCRHPGRPAATHPLPTYAHEQHPCGSRGPRVLPAQPPGLSPTRPRLEWAHPKALKQSASARTVVGAKQNRESGGRTEKRQGWGWGCRPVGAHLLPVGV